MNIYFTVLVTNTSCVFGGFHEIRLCKSIYVTK